MIENPVTGRFIRRDGPTAKRLTRQGYLVSGVEISAVSTSAPKRAKRQGFVYFLQSEADSTLDPSQRRDIKIGQTQYLPEDRRDQLELGKGCPMQVICWIPTETVHQTEAAIHSHFVKSLKHKETFSLSIEELGTFSETVLGSGMVWSH